MAQRRRPRRPAAADAPKASAPPSPGPPAPAPTAPARRVATLLRMASTAEGTPGVLLAGGVAWPLLEPPWRGNRRNRSCIPAGEYLVVPYRSPRFGRCLLVTGVEGRSHILFHSGNVAGDTEAGWQTHSRGCLLPGTRRGRLKLGGQWQRAVLASRPAVRRLLAWAAERPFVLRIVWEGDHV